MENDKRAITGALAAATCTLLGTAAPQPVQAQEEPDWNLDTGLLYYGEGDNRVQDLSFDVLARRNLLDERSLTLGFTVDSLTGATPTGALPQALPQTFTSPSGRGGYTISAGQLPVDNTFHDTRLAGRVNWQQPLGRLTLINLGATASNEIDYLHLGVNAQLSHDFFRRNTTLSAGAAVARDTVNPIGGAPVPFTQMQAATGGGGGGEDGEGGGGGGGGPGESKDVTDFMAGITQVLTRNLLVQLNYSYTDSSGYLTDPYKVLSVIDPNTGDGVQLTPGVGLDGPTYLYLYEHRPDTRKQQSLYGQAKYFMDGTVLDLSYRYMTDDWQIHSQTVDLHLKWPLNATDYLEPHLRFYRQSEAYFYRPSLNDGEPLPDYASADYRLGRFNAFTAGLKYGWTSANGSDMSVRLEWYRQTGKIPRNMLTGDQLLVNNFPDLNALILQFGYRFGR
jgi:Protein of unknown function (DUF3570)